MLLLGYTERAVTAEAETMKKFLESFSFIESPAFWMALFLALVVWRAL